MKKKIIVLVGIALCTLLLVSPVLASDAGTLGVYGNANEDDTIDMRDLTYVKLIFFCKKPETELADAKYDGKINPLDFIQIKLIIVGKEKELTIVDSLDRIVTVKKPVERIVTPVSYTAEAIRILGAKDKIVGVGVSIIKKSGYFPELSKLPFVGAYPPDVEAILELEPDAVITWESDVKKHHIDEKLPASIPVIVLNFWKPPHMIEEIIKLGYILGKNDEAKHYVEFYHKYFSLIEERAKGLSEEEKPKVYLESWYCKAYKAYSGKSYAQQLIDAAGGRNIFADLPGSSSQPEVDPEDVIRKNPDIIIRYVGKGYFGMEKTGYGIKDPSELKELRESIMNRPELAKVNAIKNKKVYIINVFLPTGFHQPVGLSYWAKWFHPDLFKDLDPTAIHQEFIDKFCSGLDYNIKEQKGLVYPPLE